MRESSAVVKQKTVPTKRLYVRKSPRRRKYHSLERGFHFAEFARGDDPVNYTDLWGLSASDKASSMGSFSGSGGFFGGGGASGGWGFLGGSFVLSPLVDK